MGVGPPATHFWGWGMSEEGSRGHRRRDPDLRPEDSTYHWTLGPEVGGVSVPDTLLVVLDLPKDPVLTP